MWQLLWQLLWQLMWQLLWHRNWQKEVHPTPVLQECCKQQRSLFSLSSSFRQLIVNMFTKISQMTGFEPRTSGIGSHRYTNWATTTAQYRYNIKNWRTLTYLTKLLTLRSQKFRLFDVPASMRTGLAHPRCTWWRTSRLNRSQKSKIRNFKKIFLFNFFYILLFKLTQNKLLIEFVWTKLTTFLLDSSHFKYLIWPNRIKAQFRPVCQTFYHLLRSTHLYLSLNRNIFRFFDRKWLLLVRPPSSIYLNCPVEPKRYACVLRQTLALLNLS